MKKTVLLNPSKGFLLHCISELKNITNQDIPILIALTSINNLQNGVFDRYKYRKNGYERIKFIMPNLSDILMESCGLVIFYDQFYKVMELICGFNQTQSDEFYFDQKRYDKRTKRGKLFFKKIHLLNSTLIDYDEVDFFVKHLFLLDRKNLQEHADIFISTQE